MIRVGLARTGSGYGDAAPPYGPQAPYPELRALYGDRLDVGPSNPAYAGVRAALLGLGLDAARFGTPDWNPFGALVTPGRRIVLKPNFIRHWNPAPGGTLASVITHGAVLRAAADYALLAAGPSGSVEIAEAPQQDCDFGEIRRVAGLDALARHVTQRCGRTLAVIDLRRECVETRDGIIVARHALPGDPRGYRVVDLGTRSFFTGSGLDPQRFRGADYDPGPTTEHHSAGRNAYLLSETVLSADLVVNLPKLKTHKKTGVTLAFKNLVGINGDKNWLPHHSLGSAASGGDEFPESRLLDRARSRAIELARPVLARGALRGLFRAFRRVEDRARGGRDFVRSGNWHGNRTTWRMCLDLNRCLYYSDAQGLHLEAPGPVRAVLTLLDGIVAGEAEGPLAPRDVPLGVVVAAADPAAVDLVAVRLMGFDEAKLPKLIEAIRDAGPRITAVRCAEDVAVCEVDAERFTTRELGLAAIDCPRPFEPHFGWKGYVERQRP